MATIPECRERLTNIAERLKAGTMRPALAGLTIERIVQDMYRKPAIRKAPKRDIVGD